MINIGIIGTGYVGLVSGVAFAHMGHKVICLDKDAQKIKSLNASIPTIYEPDLDSLLEESLKSKAIKFTSNISHLQDLDIIFIAVGTPASKNGSADLSNLYEAIDELIKHLKILPPLVIKSTVPPGTAEDILSYLKQHSIVTSIISIPEFLREGSAINDFLKPERVIAGISSSKDKGLIKKIYKPLKRIKLIFTSNITAELIKYACNSFLAMKVGFINEMSNICEKIGGDIDSLAYSMGLDSRIGKKFLKPGPGFGGSCFPKDVLAISHLANTIGENCAIISSILTSNHLRQYKMFEMIKNICGNTLRNKTITALGLTYKANTDDTRSSPAMSIIRLLFNEGAQINAYDPKGMKNAKLNFPELKINYCDNISKAALNSDVIVIFTEWKEFKIFNYETIISSMKTPIIIDLRNILDKLKIPKLGFNYISIGRKYEI